MMRNLKTLILLVIIFLNSCKKDSITTGIMGQWKWTIQYADNPAYYSTPQTTGIQETLSFTGSNYSLTQNGVVTNSGDYKTSTATSTSGKCFKYSIYKPASD